VDWRFDGQFVTNTEELVMAATAMHGAINGVIQVVMPVAFAKHVYGFADTDFDELDDLEAA
jgi:hypothetical protein